MAKVCAGFFIIGPQRVEDATVTGKEKYLNSQHGYRYYILTDYIPKVRVRQSFYNKIEVGAKVNLTKDSDDKLYEIEVLVDAEDGGTSRLRRKCINDFLMYEQITEEHHEALVSTDVTHAQKWEDFQQKWIRKLISREN